MHHPRYWCGLLAATAAAVTVAIGVPAAAARPAASPDPAAVSAPGGGSAIVSLVTGDRVAVTAADGGHASFAFLPAPGSSAMAGSVQIAGDHYVIPAVAVPFLGRQLDRSLFDVSALARDGITGAARIPVSLTFAAGTTPAAPPGVTLTSVSGTSARGYLTAGSASAFAAALRKQIGADVAAGHRSGSGSLPGGLVTMSLAAPGGPLAVTPHYPLYIVQLDVTDEAGQPANNVLVSLADNTDIAAGPTGGGVVPVADGVGRVAVAAGDYSAYLTFFDFDAQGNFVSAHEVVRNDFTVAASGVTTESFDERSATSLLSVTTPRPAATTGIMLSFWRFDDAGRASGTGLLGGGGKPVYLDAPPAVTVGRLHYVVDWSGAGPASGAPYRYDVAFAADNIPASESFTVRHDQLAVVHQHFSADPASGSATGNLGVASTDPVVAPLEQDTVIAPGIAQTMPADLTEYLGTADSGRWGQIVVTPDLLFFLAEYRTFAAGRDYSLSWAHGPLGADLGQHTGPYRTCLACTAGTTLTLSFNAIGDSDPDHAGVPFAPATAHFTLYRDGTQIAAADDQSGVVVQGIPATPSTYRAVFDLDLTGAPGFSQSTHAITDLTVQYAPGQGTALPAADFCQGQSASTPCEILPALTLNYQLATDETNTSRLPVQLLRLQVGHLSYDGAGSHAPITSASVSVSFDGGTTWQPALVAGRNGHYVASWPNPAAARGTDPELRVSATDAAGGSITQTITNAYTIATSVTPANGS